MVHLLRYSRNNGSTSLLYSFWLVFVLIGAATTAPDSQAQDITVSTYTAGEGLPNNLTKEAYQDETGYLWIATDGGLVRYDGVTLKTYTTANGLPSSYIKSVFHEAGGRTFVITDGGIAMMTGSATSPRFETVLRGLSMPSDSALFYPKAMYQDRTGALWISDARGLARTVGDDVTYFRFPRETWPDSYSRTYTVVETEHEQLLVASERGQVFLLDRQKESFLPLKGLPNLLQINAILTRPDGTLWLGGYTGIHQIEITPNGELGGYKKINSIEGVMTLTSLSDGDVLVGTATSGLFAINESNRWRPDRTYVELKSKVINGVMIDREGQLIISTDNGFAIARRQFFSLAHAFSNSAIETLTRDPEGRLYGVREHDFFELIDTPRGYRERLVFRSPEALSAIATDGVRFWGGSRNGSIFLYRNGALRKFALPSGQAINTVTVDQRGNLWTAHFKRTEIIRISRDGRVHTYGPEQGVISPINVIRVVNGSVYAGGDGDSYLYKFVEGANRFADISQPLTFKPRSELFIHDMNMGPDGQFWLASSEGLLLYTFESVEMYSGDSQIQSEEIRALTHDPFGNTWIGTGRGLFRLTQGQLTQFNHDPGLTNLTINPRSLVVDHEGRLWVGQYGGISRWSRTPGEILLTPRPVSQGLLVDGETYLPHGDSRQAPFNSFVEMSFVSLSFPGTNIRYQTRRPGEDWSAPQNMRTASFNHVVDGTHSIEVRAQQDGYMWSTPAEITFEVGLPWFRQWYSVLLFVVGAFGVLYLMTTSHHTIRSRQLIAQKRKLEALVRDRTRELIEQKATIERTNLDLKAALEQNHEFIGIAAHDLRNPLTSLVGFSELLIDNLDKSSENDYRSKARDVLPIIHRAASTMHGVIQDMLDSQLVEAGARKLKLVDTDLVEITRHVINLNSAAARRKGIAINFNPQGTFRVTVDARGMQRVLDNLISNSIKYSEPSTAVQVSLMRVGGAIRISVTDEGPGLTLDDKEKVFGKLQRLSAKPTGGENSTGLGLYIVRSIVERHSGRVGVESEPGEGAEFWIEIPVVALRAAA